jgi:hypothetical protein
MGKGERKRERERERERESNTDKQTEQRESAIPDEKKSAEISQFIEAENVLSGRRERQTERVLNHICIAKK